MCPLSQLEGSFYFLFKWFIKCNFAHSTLSAWKLSLDFMSCLHNYVSFFPFFIPKPFPVSVPIQIINIKCCFSLWRLKSIKIRSLASTWEYRMSIKIPSPTYPPTCSFFFFLNLGSIIGVFHAVNQKPKNKKQIYKKKIKKRNSDSLLSFCYLIIFAFN